MKNRLICVGFCFILLISAIGIVAHPLNGAINDDLNIHEDIEVTIHIHTIRSLEKADRHLGFEKIIDETTDPDFYTKIWIDDEVFVSDIKWNTKYLYDITLPVSKLVLPDETEIPIHIQVWDAADEDITTDRICDITGKQGDGEESKTAVIYYDVTTGYWTGDDDRGDPSGYGRLNGCDDNSYYQQELDVELWFDITQTDPDGDGIPSFMELNWYGTDPMVDDTGKDNDNDGLPIEWEWKWGYDPFVWDDHKTIDPDDDGLNNWEEYYMRNWNADPFRTDIFVEMDQMAGPNGEQGMFPEGSKEILFTAFNRRNIIFHIDDGKMGDESQAQIIPFSEVTNSSWGGNNELVEIYETYFLNQSEGAIRKGIFRYGVVIYQSSMVNGNMFGANRFQISAKGMEEKAVQFPWLNRDEVYASAYMHELGHLLNFRPIPGHNSFSYYPWQLGWWFSRGYKSCMNYGYMYYTVDYSDGSRLFRDFNDWERMNITYFQRADW